MEVQMRLYENDIQTTLVRTQTGKERKSMWIREILLAIADLAQGSLWRRPFFIYRGTGGDRGLRRPDPHRR